MCRLTLYVISSDLCINPHTQQQSTEANLRRLSNAYKLRRVTMSPEEVTVESETETLQQLIQHYHDALPLGKFS